MTPVTFPRAAPLVPRETEMAGFPSPLVSLSQNRSPQVRGTLGVGRRWSESWPPLDLSDPAVRGFFSDLAHWHRAGQALLVRPFHWKDALGTIAAGTIAQVAGADQTGTTLVTSGWPAGGTFGKGDYITIAGVPYSMDIRADATANGSGGATLSIEPPLLEGTSPAHGATVTLNGLLVAFLLEAPVLPRSEASRRGGGGSRIYYEGLQLVFQEASE